MVVEPYTCQHERSNCGPPLVVTECDAGLMEIPRREKRRLVEVRRVFLEVGARIGNSNIRRAKPFHRMRDACANLEEAILVTESHLHVSFNSHMIFGIAGFFRIERNLEV